MWGHHRHASTMWMLAQMSDNNLDPPSSKGATCLGVIHCHGGVEHQAVSLTCHDSMPGFPPTQMNHRVTQRRLPRLDRRG